MIFDSILRGILLWLLFLASVTGLVPEARASAKPPLTILHGGKIFTGDPARPWAQAIALRDGRVQATGDDEKILTLSRRGSRLIDLAGRTVVPGLNDAHVHAVTPGGVALNGPEFIPGPGPTFAEVLDLVAAGVRAHPPGTLLVVLVSTNVLDDPGANRFGLDPVSPDHPVMLQSWAGHGTYLNTRALRMLGIGEEEPDPFGGRYDRVPGTQILTGVAHEYAESHIRRKLFGMMSDDEVKARYQAFAEQAIGFGFTSIQDMATGMRHARAVAILKTADLPLRVRAICIPLAGDEDCARERHPDRVEPTVTATGIKWITDGTPIERLAFLEREAYLDRPGYFGVFNFAPQPFEALLLRGRRGSPEEHQTLFHAVGDGAIERVLDTMEATGGASVWNGRRVRIEHGDLVLPSNFQRMAELGVVVVENGTHLALPSIVNQRFAPSILAALQPLRSLLDRGIPLALGTDSVGRVQNPWVDILLAILHINHPAEGITLAEALTAYTKGSAYAEFAEDTKGTLTEGKLADLAVLSQDIFSVPPSALPGTTSVLTIVGGEIVWSSGALPLP